MALLKVKEENEWVSVEERLPENNVLCLTLTDYMAMDVCYLDGEKSFRNGMRPQHSNGGVTHWMPLPELPNSVPVKKKNHEK